MSASLVGSEMCIRDSGASNGGLSFSGSAAFLKVRCMGEGYTTLRVRSAPVSYTHLTLPTICSV
eukprot:12054689-Alexandrium_andersonii.AAC.1